MVDIAIPPAYEGTGYRRFIAYDGTPYTGRLAIELPPELAIVDEPETATRPSRSRLVFVGLPGGSVPLTRVVFGTSPIQINGGASDDLAADITISILPASGAQAGTMSIVDFNRLASMEDSAINALAGPGLGRSGSTLFVTPADPSIDVSGAGVRVGILQTDVQHGDLGGGPLHAAATQTTYGFMSDVDKAKLDLLAVNAVLGANTLTGTTTTRYLVTGFNTGTASANAIEMPVVKAFSVTGMKLWWRVAGTAGANISFVIRKNGAAVGAAVITVASDAAANTVYSATFAAVSFAPGDTWSVEVTKSAGIATSPTDVMLTVQQTLS